MPAGVQALAGGLHTDELHIEIVEKRVEGADRIRSASYAGNDGPWKPPGSLQHLRARLATDQRLKSAHHPRVWGRAHDRPDVVVARPPRGVPVANRFSRPVLARAGS